jgi:hypothetical protein
MKLRLSSHLKVAVVALLALSAVLLAGGALQASNMGFKMNKVISPLGGFPAGRNWVSLPYRNPYLKASDLCAALGLSAAAVVQQTNASNGAVSTYTCGNPPAGAFTLQLRVGVEVLQQPTQVNGILVGSHAGGAPGVNVYKAGSLPTGRNIYPVLYHGTAANAQDVCANLSLNAGVVVERTNAATGAVSTHACGNAGAFALVLGESVRIGENNDVTADHLGVLVPHF